MLPEDRAWLRDPAAHVAAPPPVPPYRPDGGAAPADGADDHADERGVDDEEMAAAGDARPDAPSESMEEETPEAVAERLRKLFRSSRAVLQPGLVRHGRLESLASHAQ